MNDQDKDKTDIHCTVEEKITKVTGEIEIRKYNKGRLLGKGGFARCFEFKNTETNQITAAKVMSKTTLIKSRSKQKLISEIKIHKALHHPNIVKFEHYFEDKDNVYLLLEICHNQSLNELLKRRKTLTELEVQCYVVQIIRALKYLHSHRIIHRDLKLGNLFISDKMELKVGDFGLATKLEYEFERKRTVCGTPNYIAPEVLDGKNGYSYEVDIWSLGVIIYTLILGKPPFETNNVKETYKRIKMNNYCIPNSMLISEHAKTLIQDILVLDPSKRPTLDDILASDFFNMGTSIPKVLQSSTLACPPTLSYIKLFIPDVDANGIVTKPINRDRKHNIGAEAIKGNYGMNAVYNNNNNAHHHHERNHQYIMLPEGIVRTLTSIANDATTSNVNTLIPNECFVKKWIDYSSKYGLGYVLSNGYVGIVFNDSTKIVYKPKGMVFIYIDKNTLISHTFNETFEKDLQKKVTLLQQFKKYLLNESVNDVERKDSDNIKEDECIYVKKWIRTKHAILFRMSNKLVQVCFIDQTIIVLSSEYKKVCYVNKKGEVLSFALSTAFDSNNNEMTKRLKYAKEILMQLMPVKQQQQQQVQHQSENVKSN